MKITRENKPKRVAPEKSARDDSSYARTAESDYAVDQLVQQVNDVLDAAILGPIGEPSGRDMIGSIAFGVPPDVASKMFGQQGDGHGQGAGDTGVFGVGG